MLDKVSNNLKILEKSLDASLLRNEVITQNIANVDTPGYKRKTVKFEEYLSDALKGSTFKGFTTDSRHIPIGGDDINSVDIRVEQDFKDLSMRLDGNNVDIEAEMATMAKNSIQYNTLIQSYNAGSKRLKNAITGGGR